MRKTLFKGKFCAKTSRRGEGATAKLWTCWRAGGLWPGAPRHVLSCSREGPGQGAEEGLSRPPAPWTPGRRERETRRAGQGPPRPGAQE